MCQKTIMIDGWTIAAKASATTLTLSVTNKDKTPVVDTEQDPGSEDELGYRLTSKGIEHLYDEQGEANAAQASESVGLKNWTIDIVNDEDNHLNIYVKHKTSEQVEHQALTNGTEHSPSCDIEISAS